MKSTFQNIEINSLIATSTTADISYGVLFILAVSGLNVYGIIIAG
jgi:NADH:ubiquinone oxidoreductase subunit H